MDEASRRTWSVRVGRSRVLGNRRARRSFAALLVVLAGAAALLVASSGSASASSSVVYSQIKVEPVPPTTNFAVSAGGDGYAVALYGGRVYNVFHHKPTLSVDCHVQSDASPCWSAPKIVTDPSGDNFATSTEAGLYLDQSTGKLWVYATRSSDSTAGVVCFDTTIADTTADPFCGFVPLSAPGEAALAPAPDGRALISTPMEVGSRLYAFNYFPNAGVSGTKNTVLCFDLTTDAACPGQPYSTSLGTGAVDYKLPQPANAAVGTQLIIPISVGGASELACFDTATLGNCSGSWPVATPTAPVGTYGAPYPLLDPTGTPTGVCLPTGADPCFTLAGAATATPAGMSAAIPDSRVSNGPALVLGPRIYVPDNWTNTVYCWDYSQGASCTNFPRLLSGAIALYTVNADPQRPTCIWVNADHGGSQIQNFDAYTGGPCVQTRVLASQFIVPQQQCYPNSYQSIQILTPDPSSYQGGSISFADGDGNPIAGLSSVPIDSTGTADLTGLDLNTPTGLPQFLVKLTNAAPNPGPLTVELTWTAAFDPTCVSTGQQAQTTTSLDATLSDGTTTSQDLTEWLGTPVTNNASLSGPQASSATGTVTYHWWTDATCSTPATADSVQTIATPGTLPASDPVDLPAGVYYETVDYGGDASNGPSSTPCGYETLTVNAIPTHVAYTGDTSVYAGDPATISFVLTDANSGQVLANMPVTLTLPDGSTYSTTTDANGVASKTVTAPLAIADYPVSESFGGQGRYLSSSGPGTLQVKPVPTNVTYTGDTSVYQGQDATISFVLRDSITNAVLPSMPVTLTLPDGSTYSTTTDANGVASKTVTAALATGSYPVSESFGGQAQYLASTGPGTLTVVAQYPAPASGICSSTTTGASGSGAHDSGSGGSGGHDSGGTGSSSDDEGDGHDSGSGSGGHDSSGGSHDSGSGSSGHDSSGGSHDSGHRVGFDGHASGDHGSGPASDSGSTGGDDEGDGGNSGGSGGSGHDSGGSGQAGSGKTAAKCEALLADPTVVSNTQLTIVAMDDSAIPTTGSCAPTALLSNGQQLYVTTSPTSGQPQDYVDSFHGSKSSKYQTLITIDLPAGLASGSYSIQITTCDGDGDLDQWTWTLGVAGDGTVTTANATPPATTVDCSTRGTKCESLLADPTVVSNTELSIVAMDDSPIGTSGGTAPSAVLSNGQALTVTTSATSGQAQDYVDCHNGSLSTKYQTLLTIALPSALPAGDYTVLVTAHDGDGDLDQFSWPISVAADGTVASGFAGSPCSTSGSGHSGDSGHGSSGCPGGSGSGSSDSSPRSGHDSGPGSAHDPGPAAEPRDRPTPPTPPRHR